MAGQVHEFCKCVLAYATVALKRLPSRRVNAATVVNVRVWMALLDLMRKVINSASVKASMLPLPFARSLF